MITSWRCPCRACAAASASSEAIRSSGVSPIPTRIPLVNGMRSSPAASIVRSRARGCLVEERAVGGEGAVLAVAAAGARQRQRVVAREGDAPHGRKLAQAPGPARRGQAVRIAVTAHLLGAVREQAQIGPRATGADQGEAS